MTGIPKQKRINIMLVSSIGSVGLISQAIDLIVVTGGQFVQSNYVSLSILIIVEILPSLIFLLMVEFKNISQQDTMSDRLSQSGGKTNNNTGTDTGVINISYRDQ